MWVLRIVAFTFFMIGNAIAGELIVKDSANSVDETVAKLTAAIENAGAKVFAVVDHAKGASSVGEELAPATLVIFGNPKIGTPIMQNAIEAGLDLPMRVLVYEDGRQTKITYLDPAALKDRHKIEGAEGVFKTMTGALNKLTDAASN